MFDSIELFEILFSRRSLIISIASCKDSGIRSVQWLFLSFPRAMKRAIYLKLIASNEICVSNAKQKSGRIIFYYVLTLNVKVEFAREGEISILIPWEWSFFFSKKKKNAHAFEARSVKNTPENTSEPTRRLTREVVENVRETPDTRRETRSTKSILPLVSSC